MAVAFGTSTSVTEASSVNTTYTAPASIADGDLLLIWHTTYNAGGAAVATTPPSGFAIVPGGTWPIHNTQAPTAQMDIYLWYKIASGESGNYVVTHASSTRRGIMARVTGADTTTPFSPNPTTNKSSGANGTTTTFLGLTTTVNDCLIMVFATDNNDFTNNLTAPTGTTPTFTERVDIGGEYLATGNLTTAGATGNKTMTNNTNGSTGPWESSMVSVQPAGAVVPPPNLVMAPMTH